jgi:hypothetical protein
MFIEVTRRFDEKPQTINIAHIIRVIPMKPQDGYGNPQAGCEIYLPDDDRTESMETYEEVKQLIRDAGVRINDK